MRILADKKLKFFLAENVSGMLLPAHKEALAYIMQMFTDIGYHLSDFDVPQDRKRVFLLVTEKIYL